MKFYELDLSDEVLDALDAMNFDECTPIQEQSIPLALEGRDLIAVAQTGTGKTAAYLLPVIDSLAGGGYPEAAINCVVMSPTRELAQQIDRQMEGFSYYLPVNSLAIFGGTDGPEFARQQRGLKMGADVVIATPGRLLAHLQMGYVDLSRVSFFILDEADRMLDMGFYDDIMTIAKQLPPTCQTLMFSATMPPKIQRMAEAILKNPAEVKLEVSRPAENIRQSAFVCYEGQKTPILRSLFKTRANKRVIVFASSKLKVKELTRELRRAGVKAAEMHSDLEQARRDEVMLDFRAGRIDILVATDIVARGIDIDDIAKDVNYDDPREAENYVHRIGRTARAGAGGYAVTLVGERDRRHFKAIEDFLEKEVLKEAVPEELGSAPSYGGRSDSGRRDGGRSGGKRAGKGQGRRDRGRRDGRKRRANTLDSRNSQSSQPVPVEAAKPKKRRHRGGRNRGRRRPGPGDGGNAAATPQQ